METIDVKNAKNVYEARHLSQRLYNNETYQMQIDSHHRFVKDWDIKSIKQLHSCDAGEYSVITAYAPGYTPNDFYDDNSQSYIE